jgi:hypothetical protein
MPPAVSGDEALDLAPSPGGEWAPGIGRVPKAR